MQGGPKLTGCALNSFNFMYELNLPWHTSNLDCFLQNNNIIFMIYLTTAVYYFSNFCFRNSPVADFQAPPRCDWCTMYVYITICSTGVDIPLNVTFCVL